MIHGIIGNAIWYDDLTTALKANIESLDSLRDKPWKELNQARKFSLKLSRFLQLMRSPAAT